MFLICPGQFVLPQTKIGTPFIWCHWRKRRRRRNKIVTLKCQVIIIIGSKVIENVKSDACKGMHFQRVELARINSESVYCSITVNVSKFVLLLPQCKSAQSQPRQEIDLVKKLSPPTFTLQPKNCSTNRHSLVLCRREISDTQCLSFSKNLWPPFYCLKNTDLPANYIKALVSYLNVYLKWTYIYIW